MAGFQIDLEIALFRSLGEITASGAADLRAHLSLRQDGTMDVDYFRPSVLDFAAQMLQMESEAKPDFAREVPPPHGMSLQKVVSGFVLALNDVLATRYR